MRLVPFTKNREAIYDLLTRAKRYHCSVSAVFELDATDLLAAIARARAARGGPSLIAALVKATSLVLEKHPRLNHHLFHGLLGKYEVDFETIACNLVLARKDESGERLLLPLVIERSNELPLEEIHATIERHKTAPLAELPQVEAMRRIERLPRLALRWFSFRARSDWKFYRRYFGTYGLSSLVTRGTGGVAGHGVANTAAAFLPGALEDRAVVHRGEIRARTMLTCAILVDHYLVDGLEMMQAMRTLKRLIERPALIGLS